MVLFISFNCYEPSQDRFIVSQLSFDFSMAGMIKPNQMKIVSISIDQIK